MVQIETRLGVKNARAIAEVPGIGESLALRSKNVT
jgi:2-keto-3-deoxy-L-rhamnonate aldolase RhmA